MANFVFRPAGLLRLPRSRQGDLVPKTVHTIAIPAFSKYHVATNSPTTFRKPSAASSSPGLTIKSSPIRNQADAVVRGSIINYVAYPTMIDPATGRASGLQVNVTLQVTSIERATGKVIYYAPQFRNPPALRTRHQRQTYFEESDAALDRLAAMWRAIW